MKVLRIALALVALCSFAALATAQGAGPTGGAPKTQVSKPAKAKTVYACEKCEMASMKGGKCPGCGQAMVPINAKVVYACEHCHTIAKGPGKCPKCGEAMEKMAHTYACEDCHTTAKKAGKCPKCGKKMKEQFVKMMAG